MSRKLTLPLAALIWLYASWAVAATNLPQFRQQANTLLSDMDQATWVTQGDGDRVLYIFFDPNCPYCHKLYSQLQPMIKADHLQLHWIPVAMLTESSATKAAAILQAKDPLKAFLENEENYDMSVEGPGGGITPAKQVNNKTRLNLAANLSILQGQNIAVIPVVVFRALDGQGFMFKGVPGDKALQRVVSIIQPQRK